MTDPFTRKIPETPPPRNFSHPDRQRVLTLSHEHDDEDNQDNPPMAPNESRHFLPLPSRIFSRSASNLQLDSESNLARDFDFSNQSLRRPGTSYTLTSRSVNDLNLTALPQNQHPLPSFPQQYIDPHIRPPSSKRLIKSPPRSPTKSARSAKSKKGGTWRNLGRKMKKVFRFGRQKKRSSKEIETGRGSLQIGSPYNFEHKETGGIGILGTVAPGTVGVGAIAFGEVGGQDRDVSGRSGGGPSGLSNIGHIRGTTELGWTDEDGTAIEDDGDSAWEDEERTRLFHEWHMQQASLGRRT